MLGRQNFLLIIKKFAQNSYNSKLNLLAKFYEKWVTGTNFIENRIQQ